MKMGFSSTDEDHMVVFPKDMREGSQLIDV
jgi:hypothetical protein